MGISCQIRGFRLVILVLFWIMFFACSCSCLAVDNFGGDFVPESLSRSRAADYWADDCRWLSPDRFESVLPGATPSSASGSAGCASCSLSGADPWVSLRSTLFAVIGS